MGVCYLLPGLQSFLGCILALTGLQGDVPGMASVEKTAGGWCSDVIVGFFLDESEKFCDC